MNNPTVSAIMTIIIANNICIVIQIEYILDNFDDYPPKPSSYVINRLVDLVWAACRKAISETIPPTRLYIPKSVSPKVWSTKREVYSDTNRTMTVRIYSDSVFFAILLFSAFIDIVIYAIISKPFSYLSSSLFQKSFLQGFRQELY